MTIQQYLDNLNQRYQLGNATEHTFRGDLQLLLETLLPGVRATNEPKRQSCGAPDYILTKNEIPVGFIEAKDIGDKDLVGAKKTGNKEQFDRYKASLENLIFTDYLDFHLYRNGEFITKIAIGELFPSSGGVPGGRGGQSSSGGRGGQSSSEGQAGIKPLPENFARFENLIKDFSVHVGQTIKSSKKLAEMMAGKARLLSDVIGNALTSDETHHQNSTLKDQMLAFKQILIHDITPKGFAGVYAQTIAYGMFAARLHDPTLPTFSRQEAAELIPKSNPFLRKLFGYIAGPDLDDRIKWIVDSLTEIFLACNVEEILKNYGKSTKMEDPIIHFYETFLSEYDPKLRKARGVWYTPAPVVNFIVRAVDDILKTEFDLPQGLADTSKTKIKVNTDIADKRSSTGYKQTEQEVHKVQILDPATGTGTFLAEVVKHIHKKFQGQQGIWSNYVETHLLPRLNGFELLMASYAMAHLQLDLLLKETGYHQFPSSGGVPEGRGGQSSSGGRGGQRLRVYLTNSLEEHHQDTDTLFANWLSSEANEANRIKRDTPVMCIIGNPPYSGISSNNGKWISDLIDDYKYVDGVHFNERKHWLNDDYVKFIRLGENFVERNGEGLLAYINNHSFLDNPTFRGMRWHLLKTFDIIYIIDLHGNGLKNETTPEGDRDENVFDIQAGVSINIFVKNGKKSRNGLGEVRHVDLYGRRQDKYETLLKGDLASLKFKKIEYTAPNYFFIPKNEKGRKKYELGISIVDLFNNYKTGIVTMGDSFIVAESKNILIDRITDFRKNLYQESEIKSKFSLGKNYGAWIVGGRNEIKNIPLKPVKYDYRPFDIRYTIFDNRLLWRWRYETMIHFLRGDNIGLLLNKAHRAESYTQIFITKYISDFHIIETANANPYAFPLYLYPEPTAQQTTEIQATRTPNLKMEIVEEIAEKLGLTFVPEKPTPSAVGGHPSGGGEFAPIDILDYIYAVLHSPTYREKYKEFLKIDFPRVPYPKDAATFWKLVKLGGEIRQIHLLESATVENYITQYPMDGDNIITRKITKTSPGFVPEKENLPVRQAGPEIGKVWINDAQYFENVPKTAWEFYIGGYQPAQKWLKDRKGRTLEFDDILHYQKIIVALSETDRLMKEIDKVGIE